MSDIKKFLFIQYKQNQHRVSFLDGELRITQQQYYPNLKSPVGDLSEGKQLLNLNGEEYTLLGNDSTYIWSSSEIEGRNLSDIEKFVDYNFGLLILEPNIFIAKVIESLTSTPILKNSADIKFAPVIYVDKEKSIAEDSSNSLCRWTKPLMHCDQREYRLCVHNVPTFEFIKMYHPEELHRVEKLYIPNEKVKNKQTFYRLVFNISFDFEYELYSFNGSEWCEEPRYCSVPLK
jgi:hypothetical protein